MVEENHNGTFTNIDMYTPEQEEKLQKLREKREIERLQVYDQRKNEEEYNKRWGLHVNDPVYVTIKGKTVCGYITRVDGYIYDVKTPYGVVEKLLRSEIRKRVVENLDNVVVPEELKTFTTVKLLELLRLYRVGYTHKLSNGIVVTKEQLKAELKNRPHIPAKNEKKVYQERIKQK